MGATYDLGTAEGTIKINYDGSGTKKAKEDLDATAGAADKSAKSFDKVGVASAAAGGILAAGLGYAVNKAIDFEHEISAIGAVSGATGAELDAMRQKALQLGADTVFSASDAALAMEELAKAGVSTKDILNGAADATVALAAAGSISLPEAATIAANAMNSFSIAAKDLPHITDLIAGAANASAIDVGEFGQSLQQAGAVAHLAGVSFDDLSVAIAEMGNAGIKGSDAGTSLKTFLQNLIPTTKQQIALFQQLGLETKTGANQFFDASGKVKSLADVSQVLQNALKGQTKEQQLATLQTLFGSDAIRAAAILADNGAAGFTKLATAMAATSAADVASARMNNTAGQIEQLKGSVETAAIAFGELLLPIITKIAAKLTEFANWVNSLTKTQKEWALGVVGTVSALLLLFAALTQVAKAIQTISAAVKIIKALEIGAKLAAVATRVWAAAQWLLDAALSPIGLVVIAILAIIVAVILVIKYHKQIGAFLTKVWGDIWSFLKAIGAWFAGPFVNFFKAAGAAIAAPFLWLWHNVLDPVWQALVKGAQFAFGIVQGIINFFMPLWKATFGFIQAIVETVWAIIGALFQVGLTIWTAIFSTALNFIRGIWDACWNAAVNTIRIVWAVIAPIIAAGIAFVQGKIQTLISWVTTAWNAVWALVVAVIRTAWGIIGPYIAFAIGVVQSVISTALGIIQGIWNVAWNVISAVISTVWGVIVAVIRTAINVIAAIFNGFTTILNKIKGFFDGLKKAAEGGVGSLVAFVGQIPGKILNALGNVGSMLLDSGRKIIQGLIDGITNMAGKVGDAVRNVLNKARDLLPFSPAKDGPFSGRGWTTYSGQAISDALAAGITDHAENAVKATLALVSKVSAVAGGNPLSDSFRLPGGPTDGVFLGAASAPRVNVQPQVIVVADLGDGVRTVVKSTIADNPGLVSDANATGTQTRNWLAPGRATP